MALTSVYCDGMEFRWNPCTEWAEIVFETLEHGTERLFMTGFINLPSSAVNSIQILTTTPVRGTATTNELYDINRIIQHSRSPLL